MRVSSLAEAVRNAARVRVLDLQASVDLQCRNLLCAKVGEACLCRLSLILEKLVEVESVVLSHNGLDALPEGLWKLDKLKELDVSHNELRFLDSGIGRLKSLVSLGLSHNNLTDLPEILCALEHLEAVDVRNNPIPVESEALAHLKNKLGERLVH
eukprot:scaffold1440_cov332-Pavlova_lutheri.AAC.5